MRLLWSSVFATLALTTTAYADAQQQFDLNCDTQAASYDNALQPSGPLSLRFDLSRAQYCISPCQQVFFINSVTPDRIVLMSGRTPDGYGIYSELNRLDGTYNFTKLGPRGLLVYHSQGQCEKAPFSGFPVGKF